MNPETINSIQSEAGIVASLILKPDLYFFSENLSHHHFTNKANGFLYYAVGELAKLGIEKVDSYNIFSVLNRRTSIKPQVDEVLSIPVVNDFINNAHLIARSSPEEYVALVGDVLDSAFRRDTFNKLIECQQMCFDKSEQNVEQKIYSTLDSVMMEFSTTSEVPQYKDVVDDLWNEIRDRQNKGLAGIPFKFPTLNQYATIEPGELFIFAAEAKQGKSMILLNEAVDLLKRDLAVLYIDSELNSRMFTCRLISHLTRIEFNRVKSGNYTEEEGRRIENAISWLKTRKFTHLYMPMFDIQSIYTAVKKIKHTQGLDVLIVD